MTDLHQPLSILLCHNYYKEAGGESSVFETEERGLRQAGHTVTVYRRDNHELDAMSRGEKLSTITNGFYSRQTITEISALIQSQRPDAAIVQNFLPLVSPSVFDVFTAHNIPVIQAVYNYRLICPDAHLFSQGEICERCIGGNHIHCVLRRCYRNSIAASMWYASILALHRTKRTFQKQIDLFMTPDQFLANKLIAGGYPAEKMRTNVNPFFVSDYTPSYTRGDYVLYLGRLVKQKGILTLLEAMRQVSTSIRLVIVGQGELEERVRQLIADPALQERVSFLGPRWGKDARDLMAAAQAIIVPSEWYDNLPQIICQANAMAKPVIASQINGIPEYISDGVNGFLFPPGNAIALAARIEQVTQFAPEAQVALARRCREFAEATFDYSSHHARLIEIIAELLVLRKGSSSPNVWTT